MNQTQTVEKTEFSIHPATKIGYVSLRVAVLENQIAFYQQVLGFQLHWRDGNRAGLGAGGADLLRLTEELNLKRYRSVTGLYHFAVLFPNRRELAREVVRPADLSEALAETYHGKHESYSRSRETAFAALMLLGKPQEAKPFHPSVPVPQTTFPARGENLGHDLRCDLADALALCCEGKPHDAVSRLAAWDELLLQRKCYATWFDVRLRHIAACRPS